MPNHPLQFQNWYLSHSEHFQEQTSIEYVGTPEFGINHLIYHQLSGMEAPIWFEITPRVAHDPVLTANTLVDAFNKAAGERLLDHGMEYPYVLNIIKKYTPLFGAHTFVFSGTHLAPEFARAMLELQQEGHTLILIGEERLSDLPILTNEDLRVTRSEAFQLAEPLLLSESQIQDAYDQTRGVFEPLWIRLNELARRPIPLRPTADGFKHPPGYEVDLDPKLLVSLLRKKEKYMEALEIAVPNCPHLVPQFIEEAGSRALLTGAHAHLHVLLEALPRDIKEDEVVMRWRIEAAYLMDKKAEIKEEVLEYLEKHEAPDVRALAVLYMIFDRNLSKQAKRALGEIESLPTLKAKTFLYSYEKEAVFAQPEEPYKALSLAEVESNHLEIIRCVKMISRFSNITFRYKEYLHWSNYGMEIVQSMPNVNANDHLAIVNSCLYSKIIQNRMDGVDSLINEGMALVDKANDESRRYFYSTLADYSFVLKDYEKSLSFWKDLYNKSDRNFRAFYAYEILKNLISMGKLEEAQKFTENLTSTSLGLKNAFKIHAHMAELYFRIHVDDCSYDQLCKLDDMINNTYHSSAYLMLILMKYCFSKKAPAKLISDKEIEIVEKMPKEVIRFYLGDKLYEKYYSVPTKRIDAKFLGKPQIKINGEYVKLPLRQIEILLILSLNSDGLSGDKLMVKLYEDGQDNYGSLKTSISKLRKLINISANPYRISDDFESDITRLIHLIKVGNVQEALKIYSGKLLPESENDYIFETRELIDSSLNNMVIKHKNIDMMISMFDINNDIILLEEIINRMDKNDPRYVILKAKHSQELGNFS